MPVDYHILISMSLVQRAIPCDEYSLVGGNVAMLSQIVGNIVHELHSSLLTLITLAFRALAGLAVVERCAWHAEDTTPV